jgi:hypothetical protein
MRRCAPGCAVIIAFIAVMTIACAEDHALQSEGIILAVTVDSETQAALNLQLTNVSNRVIKVRSNIRSILDSLFLGFPTLGGIQLKDAGGRPMKMGDSSKDGWFYPNLLSSSLDLNAENRTQNEIAEMVLKTKESKTFHFRSGDMLKLIIATVAGDQHEPPLSFRIMIPVKIAVDDDDVRERVVISEWMHVFTE